MPKEKRFKSNARWPEGTCDHSDNVTEDTHLTHKGAASVCRILEREGFGGEQEIYPLEVWVSRLDWVRVAQEDEEKTVWRDAVKNPPTNTNEVLVTDGKGEYAIAWYGTFSNEWLVDGGRLEASNYDGGCSIRLDETVTKWIPLP